MLRLPHFIVAPEIVELFGGEGATRSLLAELYGRYPCAVCGRTGQLDTDTPAAVVVAIYDQGMGPLVVRLAHPDCSSSGVVLVLHAPEPTGQLTVPAMAWLRDGRADPPSVVVVAPRVSARNIANGGDLTDVILSGLLATGFTLLTEPDTTLEQAPGSVHVTFATGQLITVTTPDGTTLYDGTLPVPDGWAELVQHTGLLGVVVVRGLDLLDPDRDHLADLHAAIQRGAAVGIAVQVDPRPRPEPTQPALPPPTQPALPPANRNGKRS